MDPTTAIQLSDCIGQGSRAIYLDLDDVICNTAVAYLELIHREFGLEIAFDNIFSFNLQKSFGLSDSATRHLFTCGHSPEFILTIDILDGAKEAIENWRAQGNLIHIVTGRHTSAYQASLEWLANHELGYDSFTMVDKYGWEDTDHDLAVTLDEIRGRHYSFGIEDNVKMAEFLSGSMGLPVLLHDRPWNRDLKEGTTLNGGGIKRFYSWDELRSLS